MNVETKNINYYQWKRILWRRYRIHVVVLTRIEYKQARDRLHLKLKVLRTNCLKFYIPSKQEAL
jgi:hypothetical protein